MDLRRYAEEVGLDMPRYRNEMKDHVYLQRVQEHLAGGKLLGIRATPAFFVNGASTDVSFGLQHLHERSKKVCMASDEPHSSCRKRSLRFVILKDVRSSANAS